MSTRVLSRSVYLLFRLESGNVPLHRCLNRIALTPKAARLLLPPKQEHLEFFTFFGRMLAKSIVEHVSLDSHFTPAFYGNILGRDFELTDLQVPDPPTQRKPPTEGRGRRSD